MRSLGRRSLAAVLAMTVASVSLVASRAQAADCQPRADLSSCVDADNLWPHAGSGPFFALGSGVTLPADQVSFGLVVSYLSRPVGLRVASSDPAGSVIYSVNNLLDATLLFGWGITDRLMFSVAAPVTFFQDGGGLQPLLASNDVVPRSALRDVRFGVAFAAIDRPRTGEERGPALTLRLDFAAPSATKNAFAGARTATLAPSATFDYRLGRVLLAAELMGRVRGKSELAGAVWGSQVGGGLGVSADILKNKFLTASAEAFALYTVEKQGEGAPRPLAMEWIASVTSAPFLAGDVSLSLGGGGPIPAGDALPLTTPRFRFDLAIRYAPTGRDRDGDGIPDRFDKCPDQPEDKDGYQDDDGCPDPDNDGDGIPDDKDRCRDAAEDFDGFQDEDGCPDPDDDNDGVPDAEDKCRNQPEDRDGFEDQDGCPDPDNDKDGIPDKADQCPNAPEDFDGYQDEDGCPDPDNDGDGVLDAQDQCPNEAEDKDGFEDDDGCADPDNDQDGVLDKFDKCPNEKETINGVDDEDGCPEPGARSLVRWDGDRIVPDTLGAFAAGKADLPKDLERTVRMMAVLARSRSPLETVVIEVAPDNGTVRALELAAARAEKVKAIFVEAGIPSPRIAAAAGDPGAKRTKRVPVIEVSARRRPRGKAKLIAPPKTP